MSRPPVFTWASNAVYDQGPTAGTPNKVQPTSGGIAYGWEPDAKPTAEATNWALNRLGLWTQYLDARALDGDHTITGTLGVTSDVTIGVSLTVTGPILRGDRTLHIPAAAYVADGGFGVLSQLGYLGLKWKWL